MPRVQQLSSEYWLRIHKVITGSNIVGINLIRSQAPMAPTRLCVALPASPVSRHLPPIDFIVSLQTIAVGLSAALSSVGHADGIK